MSETYVMEILKQGLLVGLKISGPLLIVSLIIGTLIGILMAATQVQEFTLTFVPKTLVTALVLLMLGPWMLRSMMDFARWIFSLLRDIR